MDFKDIRYNNYHISNNSNLWTDKWDEFPGFEYLPLVTQWENWLFENYLDPDYILHFMQDYWHYSVYASIIYAIIILILKQWMRVRGRPYNLRALLIIWNSILAVFSTIGVIRCIPEFYHIWVTKGFTATYCESDYFKDKRLVFWYTIFVWSKIIELIDTLFILLRNGKLINLHWIHHILTLCYSWYAIGDIPGTARWMVGMNFIAHSLMYTYYALKAMRLSIPLVISISITSIQILQMVFGLYINYKVIEFKRSGIHCDGSPSVGVSGFFLYFLFFILFMNFFIKSYLFKPKSIKFRINKRLSVSIPTEKNVDENKNLIKGKTD